ncbi:tRNA (N6-isopentenyl adenosine(37)-C2)-methylthiotransferase MiaB [Candidatus Shikimatogenerans silvanidophilus]|uniref:tRNA (N6-isopentenyl adenosine(37)-C2)-methylthiotransferase MiaB n=1 Tax=Candidatus Shikimatogenerans silvanidophilus TaxID=2782547 RepID=UPI001BA4413D|nr:tRNA (N6-isopentenyl adenosine(37)-C2)-methylthiotransferase MiaB [Candidatus Shikimatogenerans silvanidophilus]
MNNINNVFFKKNYFYIETYGCQMNIYESDAIASLLLKSGLCLTKDIYKCDIFFINTCSIREKAEIKIFNRLKYLNLIRKNKNPNMIICILGCMSERIKNNFFLKEKKLFDIVISPKDYKSIINIIFSKLDINIRNFTNIILEQDIQNNINSDRIFGNNITSFVSIMQGCDNMCTFCVVPFTRGREISRSPKIILEECKILYNKGFKEITLLGQNVDSYFWYGGGLKKNYKNIKKVKTVDFSNLIELIAKSIPIRIRFTTSNPHDFSEKILKIMKKYKNICNHIHLPVQSGSNKILKKMNRKYSREEYIYLINKIRQYIPDCSISHDIISGFCGETEEDHIDTLNLMNYVKYNYGYMFYYSPRQGTIASKKYKDDVNKKIKKRRLQEIIFLQKKHSFFRIKQQIGTIQEVLIEGISKKNNEYFYGRNSKNTMVYFKKVKNIVYGDLVKVLIKYGNYSNLIGKII